MQPTGGIDDAPAACLNELTQYLERADDIGTLWNWPRCGLPSGLHLREDSEDLLEEFTSWWGSSDLFVSEYSGQAHTLENGLLHLLQIGLLCRDLHVASKTGSSHQHILTPSILDEPDLRDALYEIIVTEATHHVTLLDECLAAPEDADTQHPVSEDQHNDYDNEDVVLAMTVEEHAADLLLDCEPGDVYMRTVQKSLELDAIDAQRVASNAAIRVQQNKDNRQRTGFIHPPKPPALPQSVPNLEFVNDIELPDVTAIVAEKRARRKAKSKAAVRVRRAPGPKRAHVASVDAVAVQAASNKPRKTKQPRLGKVLASRTRSPEGTGPPKKRRRLGPVSPASERDSDEAEESFNLDDITDDDRDTGVLPDHQSDSYIAEEQMPAASSSRRRSRSLLDETRPFFVDNLRSVVFDSVDNAVQPKPRPRPVQRGRRPRAAPGVSTSFAGEQDVASLVTQDHGSPPHTTSRRSSLRRSGTHDGVDSGVRTRSQSHSVRFAEGPPSSSTRSKSRDPQGSNA